LWGNESSAKGYRVYRVEVRITGLPQGPSWAKKRMSTSYKCPRCDHFHDKAMACKVELELANIAKNMTKPNLGADGMEARNLARYLMRRKLDEHRGA